MGMRMDKYKNENENEVPTRSDKNQELYKQIYNAYDEFENLIVPSNAREITVSELRKEITSREEYRNRKAYDAITQKKSSEREVSVEKKLLQDKPQVYDINELLDKAVNNQTDAVPDKALSHIDYLKKIKLDNHNKTNIEQVKEMYEDMIDDELEEDESLLKTANLSLEILSDLKSDNDKTVVEAPIKESELPKDMEETDFYSNNYKFSKKDFESNDSADVEENDEGDDEEDEEEKTGGVKKFFKVLLVVFGILLVIILLLYIFKFFNRV